MHVEYTVRAFNFYPQSTYILNSWVGKLISNLCAYSCAQICVNPQIVTEGEKFFFAELGT